MTLIREEVPGDYEAVRELNRTAFNEEAEAQLVENLDNDGAVILSLVAVEENNIVGHILFSDLLIQTEHRCHSCRVAGPDGRNSATPGARTSSLLCSVRILDGISEEPARSLFW